MFTRIGDAVNHMYYLRVAHGFMFNSHVDSGHGRYFIYSGTLRSEIKEIPQITEDARARVLRIIVDPESASMSDDSELKKIKLHQFFKKHQVWAAQAELFHHSQLQQQDHVLYHESVSSCSTCETIVDVIKNTQVRLTERILKNHQISSPTYGKHVV